MLIRENKESKNAVATFDFSDLLAYLLVSIGISRANENQIDLFNSLISKQRMEKSITVQEIQPLGRKETLVQFPSNSKLSKAVQVMGSGVHQVLVTSDNGDEVTGIVSQLRVVQFFWNEGVNFPAIDRLYQIVLKDLGIGTQEIIAIK